MPSSEYDAVIIGSGPNGLSAGIRLAKEGLKVLILEAKSEIGGGTRTAELTEPGFLHDVCSAIHPTTAASPFFRSLDLEKHGLEWVHPDYPYAHPLDDGRAAAASISLPETAAALGKDQKDYLNLFNEFVGNWGLLSQDIFGTLRFPKHPLLMAQFGWYGMFSAKLLVNSLFKNEETKALFMGCAAHSILPLNKAFTASFGLVLAASAHTAGWPFPKGGAQRIHQVLVKIFESFGGTIITEHKVKSTADIPPAKAVLFDLSPHQIIRILSDSLPADFRKKLEQYKYGPGVFKMDFALSEPVPWLNDKCKRAGTLHLGGNAVEIADAENKVWKGEHPDSPYVLVAQQSLFDETRAPEGKHTLWAYCHVPNGSEKDVSEQIINQIERFAPGFRDVIISSHSMNTQDFESYNSNYIGGDINGGAQFARQIFGRPVLKFNPYKLPVDGMYICSASTPPGGGVHGMSGFHAAESALKNEFSLDNAKAE